MIHGEGGGRRLFETAARSALTEGLSVSLTNIRGYGIYSNYGYLLSHDVDLKVLLAPHRMNLLLTGRDTSYED